MNVSNLIKINQIRKTHDQARQLIFKLAGFSGFHFDKYCQSQYKAYQTLIEVSGKSVVVDSTKQTGRAWNLLKCQNIDVYLVHLVRDGRGVIWSRLRDKIRDPMLSRKSVLSSTLAWIIKNLLSYIIGRYAPKRYINVKYEDLSSDPEKELRRIGKMCGIDMQDVIEKLAGSIYRQGHQIGGNKNARSGQYSLQLRPDVEWQKQLPKRYDFIFRIFAGWMMKFFGY